MFVNEKFGTAINCIDGRVQLPLLEWMRKNFGLDYVDMITELGVDRVLAEGSFAERSAIEKKAKISFEAHRSKIIVVAGHHDCAGNPVSEGEHSKQMKKAVQVIRSWKPPVKVVGVWIGEGWSVVSV